MCTLASLNQCSDVAQVHQVTPHHVLIARVELVANPNPCQFISAEAFSSSSLIAPAKGNASPALT